MLLAAWYHPLLAALFAFLAVVTMIVILLQRGKGVGLSGAFGGTGGHTAFGAKTGDVLTWATIVLAGLLLVFAVFLNFVFVPPTAPGLNPAPAPAAPTPAPAAGEGESQTQQPAAGESQQQPAQQQDDTQPAGGGETPGIFDLHQPDVW